MKHFIFFFFFLVAQDLTAQCDSYLSIETLIKIKKDFDEAEDLLITCFTLDSDKQIDYADSKGRVVSFVSNKEIDFGKCTAKRESIGLYYKTAGVRYVVRDSSHYLTLKNVVKKSGKKLPAAIERYNTYSYRGLEWSFGVGIDEKCKTNDYNIAIYNLN